MKNDTIKTIIVAIIFIFFFSSWNAKLIEAKQDESLTDPNIKEEVLWLARVVYSETKNASEQVLVAWVVRNRVETGYKGDSYKEVARSKAQFSGLNTFDSQYLHNISRSYDSGGEVWRKSLDIAKAVYNSPGFLRPFSQSVRHFYSPKSVSVDPEWSAKHKPVIVIRDDSRNIRFAFYEGVK